MQNIGKVNRMVSNQYAKAWSVLDRMGFKKANDVWIYGETPDLEIQTDSVSTTLTYENNRLTATPGPTIVSQEGDYPIAFEYVQNKVSEGDDRGKWLIDFAVGVENPFGRKEIDSLVYVINGNHRGTIKLERDPLITNALAYRSIGIDANMASFDTINSNVTIVFYLTYKDFRSLNLKRTMWFKLKPTPKMFLHYDQKLYGGGIVASGGITLTSIPFNNGETEYDYDFLSTSTHLDGEKKFYIIDGWAYTVSDIEKTNFFWTVKLMRYDSINKGTYQPPEA